VGLDVGVIGFEEGLGSVTSKILSHIDVLTSTVIPLVVKPLGILVGEDGPHGLQYRRRHEVLARDELELGGLATGLRLN